ncbi:MAG: Pimeloyl-ACP methyl ester carboxylesterase [Ferruginibacter sp.]|uniref:alpha/beta fold hydrolase n=1 Tax=Ferruginibacter sp. TaxID=1940288 RepID=UPI002659275D|nr:alpha/beta hydrolase [Ferruginibacter sp.]MDB5280481.1 Pimeloyl-ACP methyl ester carboxylesterase [Ferruginibacter sp.]
MKKLLVIAILSLVIIESNAQKQKSFSVTVTGKGQPVILIPGFSCSGDVWKETVDHLKGKFQCHIITLAGYAGTPAIDSPGLKIVRDELIHYVQQQHLNKPIVIGHSLGSFMGLWINSTAPELFGKLVCVDGMPFYSALNDPNANADSLKNNPSLNEAAVIKSFDRQDDPGFVDMAAKALAWQVADTIRARQIATWQYRSNKRTLGITLIELATTDLRKDIAQITSPVLVLGSIYFTKEKSYELIGQQFKNLPSATIHVADSKHFIMYDQPQWFYHELDAFLN